jgi:hypothetical protein
MLLALFAAPAVAWLVYRLAKALGFLDPPVDQQHEQRRTIIVALYAFLLFLPVLIFGFGRGWPRAWILFGIFNALVLVFFAWAGIRAAVRLWKLRFPPPALPEPAGPHPDDPGRLDFETGHAEAEQTR